LSLLAIICCAASTSFEAEDQLNPIETSFLDGMLRFVATIAGWIFLPVGCFFRQSKLA